MTDNYSDTTRRKKDDKIKTLVRELEALENENDTLKRKLEILKDEMEDATENMNGTTEELERLRSKNITYKGSAKVLCTYRIHDTFFIY